MPGLDDDICRFLAQHRHSSGTAHEPKAHGQEARRPALGRWKRIRKGFGIAVSTVKQVAKVLVVGGLGAATVILVARVHSEHCRALLARGAEEARQLMQQDWQQHATKQQKEEQSRAEARERAAAAELDRALGAARAAVRAELEEKLARAERQLTAAREVQQHMAAAEEKVTAAEQKVAAAEQKVAAAEERVAAVQSDMRVRLAAMQEGITRLQAAGVAAATKVDAEGPEPPSSSSGPGSDAGTGSRRRTRGRRASNGAEAGAVGEAIRSEATPATGDLWRTDATEGGGGSGRAAPAGACSSPPPRGHQYIAEDGPRTSLGSTRGGCGDAGAPTVERIEVYN